MHSGRNFQIPFTNTFGLVQSGFFVTFGGPPFGQGMLSPDVALEGC